MIGNIFSFLFQSALYMALGYALVLVLTSVLQTFVAIFRNKKYNECKEEVSKAVIVILSGTVLFFAYNAPKEKEAHKKELSSVAASEFDRGYEQGYEEGAAYGRDSEKKSIEKKYLPEIDKARSEGYKDGYWKGFEAAGEPRYEVIIPSSYEEAYELGREAGAEWAIDEYNIDW